MNLEKCEKGGILRNISLDKNISLLAFAKSEWQRLNAKGRILNGVIPYIENVVMSYILEL